MTEFKCFTLCSIVYCLIGSGVPVWAARTAKKVSPASCQTVLRCKFVALDATKQFRAKNFNAALAGYERAYALVPDKDLLFGLARSYEELKNCDKAQHYFRLFLSAPPPYSDDYKKSLPLARIHVQRIKQISCPDSAPPQEDHASAPPSQPTDPPPPLPAAPQAPAPAAPTISAPPPPIEPLQRVAASSAAASPVERGRAAAPTYVLAQSVPPPVHRRWWFWTVLGGAAAAVAATAAGLAIRLPQAAEPKPPEGFSGMVFDTNYGAKVSVLHF